MTHTKLKQWIINGQSAIIIAVLAQITIPLGFVPLTGQTLGVGIIATLLSPLNSTIAVSIYLLLGGIGLPVFAGFNSGLGVLVGPTGGYLVGFIFNTLITSYLIQKRGQYTLTWTTIANIIGAIVTLIFGTLWLKVAANLSWQGALANGFIPFILPGILKAWLASFIGVTVYKALTRAHISLN